MRYLGIDYGKKRVGIALSDENGQFALAHSVLPNDKKLIQKIADICKKQAVSEIILGESFDFKGRPNAIMEEISAFKAEIEKTLGLPVHLEPEFMTSAEAEHIQGKSAKLDASAAALILKSFLDKKANSN